jgi:hypothetical protein
MSGEARLEDDRLWLQASKITNAAYGVLDTFPEDERYLTVPRLRQHASSLVDEVAQGVGSIDPRDIQYHLGHARRDLFGIKSVYKASYDNGLLKLEPEQMVSLDKLIADINNRLERIPADIKEYFASLNTPEMQDTKG